MNLIANVISAVYFHIDWMVLLQAFFVFKSLIFSLIRCMSL